MQLVFAQTELVRADIETTWLTMTNWDRLPEWMANVSHAEGPAHPARDDSIRLETTRGARDSTITDVAPLERLELTSTSGPVTAVYSYRLTEASQGTKVDVRVTCHVSGPARVFAPLIRRSIRRADGTQLRALRQLIE